MVHYSGYIGKCEDVSYECRYIYCTLLLPEPEAFLGSKREFNEKRTEWYRAQKENRTALYVQLEEQCKRINNARCSDELTDDDRSVKEDQLLSRFQAAVSTLKVIHPISVLARYACFGRLISEKDAKKDTLCE